jgi:adenylate cyclase
VLFSDIEGFTAFAETMQPEELVSILNEYLSIMSGIIFRNDGTLDKYEGDAVMAFWGAPIPQRDHALHACQAALEMQESLADLNVTWAKVGRPAIRVRIGINTGDMVVGNMGAEGKFAYTVIGDSVNLASRLEGANKEYRTSVMVSERTYSRVKDVIVGRQLDRITVKGRSEPVTVFELLQPVDRGVGPDLEEFLELYGKGLGAYYRKDWAGASTAFERALALRPNDYPARLHLERVQAYRVMPPPENWDGTFVMQRK